MSSKAEIPAFRAFLFARGLACATLLLLLAIPFATDAAEPAAPRLIHQVIRDTSLRVAPNAGARSLGVYRAGLKFAAGQPNAEGWVEIRLSKPVKGFSTAWLRAADLKAIRPVAAEASGAQSSVTGAKRARWLALRTDFQSATPTAYQTAIQEPASSVSFAYFGLEYRSAISDSLAWKAQGFFLSVSQASSTLSIDPAYWIKGFGLAGGLSQRVAQIEGWNIGLEATLGLATCTAGNRNAVNGIATTNLLSPVLAAEVGVSHDVGKGVSLDAHAGYRYMSLSKVPAVQSSASQAETAADVSLGTTYFGLSVRVPF